MAQPRSNSVEPIKQRQQASNQNYLFSGICFARSVPGQVGAKTAKHQNHICVIGIDHNFFSQHALTNQLSYWKTNSRHHPRGEKERQSVRWQTKKEGCIRDRSHHSYWHYAPPIFS
jgi:hypothetical protein